MYLHLKQNYSSVRFFKILYGLGINSKENHTLHTIYERQGCNTGRALRLNITKLATSKIEILRQRR